MFFFLLLSQSQSLSFHPWHYFIFCLLSLKPWHYLKICRKDWTPDTNNFQQYNAHSRSQNFCITMMAMAQWYEVVSFLKAEWSKSELSLVAESSPPIWTIQNSPLIRNSRKSLVQRPTVFPFFTFDCCFCFVFGNIQLRFSRIRGPCYQPTEIGMGYTALSLSVYHTCALQGARPSWRWARKCVHGRVRTLSWCWLGGSWATWWRSWL